MRSAIVASLVAVVLSTSSVALAEGSAKKKKSPKAKASTPVLVAAAVEVQPLPVLPEPVPAPPPPSAAPPPPSVAPAKDAPATSSSPSADRPRARPGFAMAVGTGFNYLGGAVAKDIDLGAALVTVDLKLGGYVTPHVGIMAGLQVGVGSMWDGCSDTCGSAGHLQFPIVVQYAFKDRSQGAYVEGGLGLLSTYVASTDSRTQSDVPPEKLSLSSPVDVKVGVGYRIPVSAARDKASTSAVDIRLAADVGQFRKLAYENIAGSVEGDIASDRQATHFIIGLSAGYHFAP